VATANSFRDGGVLGIYSVSTLPETRRRGYATALTARAVHDAPELDAVLQPSQMAERLYRRIGFEPFSAFRTWIRSRP
jgi:predicted GNAT family acetyltransferase